MDNLQECKNFTWRVYNCGELGLTEGWEDSLSSSEAKRKNKIYERSVNKFWKAKKQ